MVEKAVQTQYWRVMDRHPDKHIATAKTLLTHCVVRVIKRANPVSPGKWPLKWKVIKQNLFCRESWPNGICLFGTTTVTITVNFKLLSF